MDPTERETQILRVKCFSLYIPQFPNFNVHQDHLQHLLDVLDFVPGGADSVGLEPENSHFFFFFKFSDDSDATRAGPQRPSSLNSIVPKGRA